MKSTDLRPGMAIRMDGNLYIITQFIHVTPGNLRAFVSVKIKNIATHLTVEKRLRSGEEIEQVMLDKRDMEYLYSDATGHVFMDQESYDQIPVSDEQIGEMMKFIKPNTVVGMLLHEGKIGRASCRARV